MRVLNRLSGRQLLILAVGLLAAGIVMLAVGIAVFALGRDGAAAKRARQSTTAITETALVASEKEATAPVASWASSASPSLPTTSAPATAQSAVPLAAPTPSPAAVAPTGNTLVAYRGLGSWVDIYDDRAWKDPGAAVADMAKHGVKTLYLETGNSRSKGELFKPEQLRQFITAAHAHDMKVVAWYLPDLKDLTKDYARIDAAIKLTTSDGQKFDSFALDIESGAVKSPSARNKSLIALSKRVRDGVGPSYPLGAIIPSPVGLSKSGSYWPSFPYTELAGTYDVFVPMGYYTYHGDGGKLALSDTLANARILRAQKGCSAVPIHMIGGVAENSSAAEVREFVRGSKEAGCIGAGLYGWAGTKAAHWQELAGFGAGAP